MNKPSADDPWNADLYRSQHNFVFEYGRGLTDIMPLNPGDQLLDRPRLPPWHKPSLYHGLGPCAEGKA